MELRIEEHVLLKQTDFGPVEKKLNQHKVFLKNTAGEWRHVGYVGTRAFLPLSGFPPELVASVSDACAKELGRKLESVSPPPSKREIEALASNE